MRILRLLIPFISIVVILLFLLGFFVSSYFNLNSTQTDFKTNIFNLENKIESDKQQIEKLKKLKKEFEIYLKSSEFKPIIRNFKDFVILSKKIDDYKELNELNFNYKFGSKKKAIKDKYYYELTLNAEYSNINEIVKLINYIKDIYKTKVIDIDFKNNKINFNMQILSENF